MFHTPDSVITPAPELRWLGEGENKQPVAELRVRFPNVKRINTEAGEDEYIERGFWVTVNVWGRFAEPVAKLFSKGDQIFVIGNLYQDEWKTKETDEIKTGLKMDARQVFPWSLDLESLSYKERKGKPEDYPAADDEDNEPF